MLGNIRLLFSDKKIHESGLQCGRLVFGSDLIQRGEFLQLNVVHENERTGEWNQYVAEIGGSIIKNLSEVFLLGKEYHTYL